MLNQIYKIFLTFIINFYISVKILFVKKYTYRASTLAFTTLLSLVPLLSVMLFAMSWLPYFSRLMDKIQNYLFSNFVPSASVAIESYLRGFMYHANRLPLLGIFFLFFLVVLLVSTIKDCLDEIWKSEGAMQKTSTGRYWVLLGMAPIFFLCSLIVSFYVFSLPWFADKSNLFGSTLHFVFSFPIVINTFIFSAFYILVPNYKIHLGHGILGGFITAVNLEIAKAIFGFYISKLAIYGAVYGVFSSIPIFLIWLYIFWLIVLLGAIFVHTSERNPFARK